METAIFYALKQLEFIGKESGFTAHQIKDSIYIEFPSGKNLKLDADEIKHQAIEYLNAEIDSIKH